MSKVTIEYFGVSASGKNVTEAKRNAGEIIRQALDGNYSPEIIAHDGCAVLVYRDPQSGWRDAVIQHRGESVRNGDVYGAIGGQYSRKEAIQHARAWVAQLTWHVGLGVCEPPAELQLTPTQTREYKSYAQWQVSYRAAIDAGLNDNFARQFLAGFYSSVESALEAQCAAEPEALSTT